MVSKFHLSPLLSCVIIVTVLLTGSTNAIICYICDSIDASDMDTSQCTSQLNTTQIINTKDDLGDEQGLYTKCLKISSWNGTLLHLGAYPEGPYCQDEFKELWKASIEGQLQMPISLDCCSEDLCNGSQVFGFSLSTILTVFVFSKMTARLLLESF